MREEDLLRHRVGNLEDLGGAYEGDFMVIHKLNKTILRFLVRNLSLRIKTFCHKLFYLNLIRKGMPLKIEAVEMILIPIADLYLSFRSGFKIHLNQE